MTNPTPSPKKKSNVLVWILGGCGVVLILAVLGLVIAYFFLQRSCKRAGFDSELMKTNPGYAAAKMAVTMSPDVEVLSSDDSAGTLKVRDKKTGKVTTLRFDAAKKSMVVIDESGKEGSIQISGEGDKGGVVVQGPEGTAKFGIAASGDLPSWLPAYPGSSPQGTFSAQTKEGKQATFTFTTKDAPAQVMSFYQEKMKAAGFTITMTTSTPQGGMVAAEDAGKKHTMVATISTASGGSSVALTAVEKD